VLLLSTHRLDYRILARRLRLYRQNSMLTILHSHRDRSKLRPYDTSADNSLVNSHPDLYQSRSQRVYKDSRRSIRFLTHDDASLPYRTRSDRHSTRNRLLGPSQSTGWTIHGILRFKRDQPSPIIIPSPRPINLHLPTPAAKYTPAIRMQPNSDVSLGLHHRVKPNSEILQYESETGSGDTLFLFVPERGVLYL
jgi:hypothetical protein